MTPVTDAPITLGDLRAAGYENRTVKDELRANLLAKMALGEELFPGILGFDETVVPALERGILAGHDLVLLGERGQAKTRLVRAIVNLLDETVPAIEGCEIHDDPYRPICARCRALVFEEGDATPIVWLARDDRYAEKLATPDTSVADLIGDVDPIRVAEGRYLGDELTIHYGMIPRTQPRHRRDQRASRPAGADPGVAVQHHGGARRADPRVPDPPAARPPAGGDRQPGRLHAPRPDRVAPEGPVRNPGPYPLSGDPARRDPDHGPRGPSAGRRRRRPGSGVHEGDRGGADSGAAALAARESPQWHQRPVLDREPRDARRRGRAPRRAYRRARGRSARRRPARRADVVGRPDRVRHDRGRPRRRDPDAGGTDGRARGVPPPAVRATTSRRCSGASSRGSRSRRAT